MSENIVTRKIEDIILDPNINTREVDSDIVVEYQESINGYHREVVQGNGSSWQDHWNELPRITKSNHLWSGFHTVTAAREVFSGGEIRCIVEGETHRDAYFLATRTNAQHGRRRTNAEKQASVDRWLNDEEMNQWTDSYIAKLCYVSQKTVSNRRALSNFLSQPTKRKFINAKGDIEWMHTTRIGKAQAPPPPKADQFPPPLTAKLKYEKFDAMIRDRDAAYKEWEAYCEQWEIPFDWESFCLYAEKYLDGRGCVSAINPEEATLDQIHERSLTWQAMKSAISHGVNWVVSHRAGLEFTQKQKAKVAEQPSLPEKDIIKLGGLRSVLGRLHAIGSLEEQVGDGTRHAALYETTPENVLALRDEILADSEPEQPQPTELQIQPVTDPEPETILLEDDTYTKEHLLNCKRSITELAELQGVPLIIKFAAEEFLETIDKSLLVKEKEEA